MQLFTEHFMDCLDICAPVVTKEMRRPPAPWITDDLKTLMKQRNQIQFQLKHDQNNVNLQNEYRMLKRSVKRSIRNCKTNYYNNKLQEHAGDTAAVWCILKDLLPNKKNKTSEILRNDETLEERAEQFNTFFASVGKHTFEKAQHHVKYNGGIL